MSFTFAIIGGGLAGTSMFYQFVAKAREEFNPRSAIAAKIKIQVFEKQNTFGPGFPHSGRNVLPFHITNMCAKDMGILFDKVKRIPTPHRRHTRHTKPETYGSIPTPIN